MTKLKKRLTWLLGLTILTVVAGEVFARYVLGLGDPPISIADPKIEYMLKPDQDVNRFGNRIIVNHFGMRSLNFPVHSTGHDIRIMAFGDSVLYGGSRMDHADLATTIVQNKQVDITGQEVIVGNISSISWGPGNWLAYANKYGFFDADIVILVLSSHDYADNPRYRPLDPDIHPTKKPFSALFEGITRYLPRYLPILSAQYKANSTGYVIPPTSEEEAKGLEDLKQFLLLAKSTSKHVLVFQHWEKKEIERGKAKDGHRFIAELCESLGLPTIQLKPYFLKSMQAGINPYKDYIHPNQVGNQLIAEAILEHLPSESDL